MSTMSKIKPYDVVLVTGGSGFVGQHIVKLLQEKDKDVKEIRVFDRVPYTDKLCHTGSVPVKSIVGDLRSSSDLNEALKGVGTVIHTAGVVSFGTFPDYKAMEQVNVKGTANVIDSCVQQNVPRLIFTSTIDVVIGYEEIIDGDETLSRPKEFLFPGYPDTKSRAECMVVSANGMELAKGDGSRLSTMSLRPNVMFGEGDPFYIPNALRAAKNNCGVLPRIGNGKALFQQSYVGNTAWAHILAARTLRENPELGGQCLFIPDDTPIRNSFDLLEPFLSACGFKLALAKRSIPYPLIYGALYLTESVLWLISPLYKLNLQTPLCSMIYINKTYYFNRKRAEKVIGYTPLYDYNESLEKSLKYYMEMKI